MTAASNPAAELTEAGRILAVLDSHRLANVVCTCMAWSASYESDNPAAEHRDHLAARLAAGGAAADEGLRARVEALAEPLRPLLADATPGPMETYQNMNAEHAVCEVGRGAFGVVALPATGREDYGRADIIALAAARNFADDVLTALDAAPAPTEDVVLDGPSFGDYWPVEAAPTVGRADDTAAVVERVRALADEWDATADRCRDRDTIECSTCVGRRVAARELRAAAEGVQQ